MALLKKRGSKSTSTTTTSTQNSSLRDKRQKRTLVKQQQMSERIYDISNELLAKASEGVSAIEQLKSAAEQISAAAEENAGAAEESLSSVNEIQKNSEMIVKNALLMEQEAQGVKDGMDDFSKEIKKIYEKALYNKDVALSVVEKSNMVQKAGEEVKAATELIRVAADQTNLLALNAAIEAAKAKEHGKGFAVVASETRALAAISEENALKTQQEVAKIDTLSKEINQTLGKIQESIQTYTQISIDTQEQSDKSASNMVEAMNRIKKSVISFEQLQKDIEQMQKGSESIASAAEEQSSAINQVTSAINTQAAALAQAEQACNNLVEMAEDLKHSTDTVKTAEEIASAAEELSSAIEEILGSIKEVVSALDQIEEASAIAVEDTTKNREIADGVVRSVNQINSSLEEVHQLIENNKEALEAIKAFIGQLTTGINDILEDGKDVTKNIKAINKSLKEMTKILASVDNVIVQIALLAVNGNVEAARAGDFGKGFAVVSTDIRNLAQESAQNLSKIVDIVDTLEEELEEMSIEWMEASKSQNQDRVVLENTNALLETFSKKITEFETNLQKLLEANLQNKEAIEQFLEAAKQIESAIELSRNNANESKSAAQLIEDTISQMGEFVEELALIADELQQG